MEENLRKAKTHKGRQYLQKFENQMVENGRKTLFLKGQRNSKDSLFASQVLKTLKKHQSVSLNNKNDFHPFENTKELLFLTQKNLCPLFVMTTGCKKRPNGLIIGRVFKDQVLELFEFEVQNCIGEIEKTFNQISDIVKPIFICNGEQFEFNDDLSRLRNLMHDLIIQHNQEQQINIIRNLNLAVAFNEISNDQFQLRFFQIDQGTSQKLEIGFDLKLKRKLLESKENFQKAIEERKKEQKQKETKNIKNVKKNAIGESMGRVHVKQQDIWSLKIKKSAWLQIKDA